MLIPLFKIILAIEHYHSMKSTPIFREWQYYWLVKVRPLKYAREIRFLHAYKC